MASRDNTDMAGAAKSRSWQEIEPKDATHIVLGETQPDDIPEGVTWRQDVVGPRNEEGEMCPWPWDPQQLKGAPLGQYHCGYCGAMVLAGMEHPDYTEAA